MTDSQEFHQGYDPEKGLIERVREWTDVFPWLRLGRVVRVAASPVLFAIVFIAFAIWSTVAAKWILVEQAVVADVVDPSAPIIAIRQPTILDMSVIWLRAARLLPMVDLYAVNRWRIVTFCVWTLICWTPVALLLARQGAVLTAGRDLQDSGATLKRSFQLTPKAWLSAMVPFACVLCFCIVIMFVAWIGRLFAGVAFLEHLMAMFVAIIALPCGILGFGALGAVPLGWAALANESDADALDSLSRGYEYVYRRFLKLALYLFLCGGMLALVYYLASGIAFAASSIANLATSVVGAQFLTERVDKLFSSCPLLIAILLFWSLMGGVYLLLRRDAGGQDVEDLLQPAPLPKPPLPELTA